MISVRLGDQALVRAVPGIDIPEQRRTESASTPTFRPFGRHGDRRLDINDAEEAILRRPAQPQRILVPVDLVYGRHHRRSAVRCSRGDVLHDR